MRAATGSVTNVQSPRGGRPPERLRTDHRLVVCGRGHSQMLRPGEMPTCHECVMIDAERGARPCAH